MKKRSTRRLTLIGSVMTLMMMGSSFAHADSKQDRYLVFHTVAYHFEKANERNGITPGIGLEYSPSGKLGYHIGTVRDSFNYQATYAGFNYATPRYPMFNGRLRFIFGLTALHKQYHPNSEPETKIVPLPVMELQMSKKAVINISGSPEIDYNNHHNNAVLFFQFKWNL